MRQEMFDRLMMFLTVIVVALLLAPVFAAAQVDEAIPLPTGSNQAEVLVIGLYSVLISALVEFLKTKVLPRVPRSVILMLPYVIGAGVGLIGNYIGGLPGGVSGWEGIAAALGAHALHEVRTTVSQHGITGKS